MKNNNIEAKNNFSSCKYSVSCISKNYTQRLLARWLGYFNFWFWIKLISKSIVLLVSQFTYIDTNKFSPLLSPSKPLCPPESPLTCLLCQLFHLSPLINSSSKPLYSLHVWNAYNKNTSTSLLTPSTTTSCHVKKHQSLFRHLSRVNSLKPLNKPSKLRIGNVTKRLRTIKSYIKSTCNWRTLTLTWSLCDISYHFFLYAR